MDSIDYETIESVTGSLVLIARLRIAQLVVSVLLLIVGIARLIKT